MARREDPAERWRREERQWRWFAPIAAVVLFGGGLLLGGSLWWQDHRAGDEAGQWMAAAIVIATVSAAGWFVCHVDRHAAPDPFVAAEALVIPQSAWTGMSRIAAATPWGLYFVAATWRDPELSLFTVPLAAYLLGPVILRLAGRWRPGGLWFDSVGVTYRSPGSERSLAWSQIAAVEEADRYIVLPEHFLLDLYPVPGLAIRAADGSTVTDRSLTPLWRYRPRRKDAIFVRTETLRVPPADLEHFCATLIRWPKARADLATPAILEAIEDPRTWRRRYR